MKATPKIALLALILCQSTLHALPVLDNAAAGVKVDIIDNSTMEILQPADLPVAINDWRSFDIAAKEHVNFAMAENAISVNRVLGNNQSQIFGKLTANGKLILVNPNGFLFGKGSEVFSGNFLATASDLSHQDLMQSPLNFDNTHAASGRIINEGTITVRDAGIAALVAPHVENNGTINAKLGVIALGSGRQFTLDLHGDGLIHFAADTAAESRSLIQGPEGKLIADGGRIQITTQGARQVVNNAVNLNGLVKANKVSIHRGQIILSGGNRTNVRVTGKLQARGKGSIKIHTQQTPGEVRPPAIELVGTSIIDVSSTKTDGGEIVIGSPEFLNHGNTAKITVMPGAKLIAKVPREVGDGGRIVLAASDEINMMGSAVSSQNGSVKIISGKELDISHAEVSAQYGTWKLEAPVFELDDINAKPLNLALRQDTNVQIRATSMLRLSNDEKPVAWDTPANLSLYARKHLEVSPDAQFTANGDGNITVRVDAPVNTHVSSMNFITTQIEPEEFVHIPSEKIHAVDIEDDFVDLTSEWKDSSPHLQPAEDFVQVSPVIKPRFITNTGDISFQYNTTEWDKPHNFSPYLFSKSGKATQYMLVSSAHDLQKIAGFLDQNFALKGNINLDKDVLHQPIGDARKPYSGIFEGNHYSITHLRVDKTDGESGLFGAIKNAKIKNLTLRDLDVRGNLLVGGVVGTAESSELFRVHGTGNVAGIGTVGGIVGYASHTDMNYLSANVKVIEADIAGGIIGTMHHGSALFNGIHRDEVNGRQQAGGIVGLSKDSSLSQVKNVDLVNGRRNVGGIVGSMQGQDAILTSANNMGAVHGTQWVGGLVGTLQDHATISNSDNSGEVTGEHHVGGVVGRNLLASKVRDVTNQGTVTGIENVGGIGGFQDEQSFSQNIQMRGKEVHGHDAVGGLYGTNLGNIFQGVNTSYVNGALKVGGVVGNHEKGTIDKVKNLNQRMYGQMEVGGLAGFVGSEAILKNGENQASPSGIKFVGGIVGTNYGLVEAVVNHGDSVQAETKVGPIFGLNEGKVQNAKSYPSQIFEEIELPKELIAGSGSDAAEDEVKLIETITVAPINVDPVLTQVEEDEPLPSNNTPVLAVKYAPEKIIPAPAAPQFVFAPVVAPTAVPAIAPAVTLALAPAIAPAVALALAPAIVPAVAPAIAPLAAAANQAAPFVPPQVRLNSPTVPMHQGQIEAHTYSILHYAPTPALVAAPSVVYISGLMETRVPKILSVSKEDEQRIHLEG